MKVLGKIFKSHIFEKIIIALVFINAICIGLEVSLDPQAKIIPWLSALDKFILFLFCMELFLKLTYYRKSFFYDPWRIFDFLVISVALIPASGPLSVLRAFRIIRVLRMISVIPRLRQVVNGLMSSIPGLGAVGGILVLGFYVAAVMATALFGQQFSQWFGSIPKSAYSLFQIMTLESWSMGLVRPVMEKYPYAWLFFLPFIIITTFIMLNLMIAVIINAMQIENTEAAAIHAENGRDERMLLLQEIKYLQQQVKQIKANQDKQLYPAQAVHFRHTSQQPIQEP